jgi:hypothetical protein
MMHFLERSMRLLRKIKGKISLSEVSNLLLLWTQRMQKWILCMWFLIWRGVLVGKEYFKVNHFLLPLFNWAWGPTLLGKNIIPRLILKEFLFMCLKQFTIYIWTSPPFAKMNRHLRKIAEETSIEIDLWRIMGRDLCKINKHFLQFPIKLSHYRIDYLAHDKLIYHKTFLIYSLGILILTLGIHFW